MKKLRKLFLVGAALFISNLLVAQAFDDGKNLLSLGFGFPATSVITKNLPNYQNELNYNYKNYGTIVLKFEHGMTKYFGVGLNLEYSSASLAYDYTQPRPFNTDTTYHVTINNTLLAAYLRLNGHYPIGDKLDIFGGFGLGYAYQINNYNDNNPDNTGKNNKTQSFQFDWQFTLGLRYMIKDHFGLFAEIGWATTTVQMGLTFGF
ncbi:MAG TPA: outer membrane beta-barrel protein [Bacteroidia bacterium]|jgi:hypothetical protein|nr:outer membrane beta-barrel protein [Bacteroidia bacterium]